MTGYNIEQLAKQGKKFYPLPYAGIHNFTKLDQF